MKFLDFELRGDVLSTLDWEMLLGDGTGEHFEGIFYADGINVQTFSITASETLRRAMAIVEQRGYDAGPRTVWGVPVVSSPVITEGLAVVGDLISGRPVGTREGPGHHHRDRLRRLREEPLHGTR